MKILPMIIPFIFLTTMARASTNGIPHPPESKPPAFPDGYVLHPNTNGVLQLWKVAGSITVTNAPAETKRFIIHPEVMTSNGWDRARTAITIDCESESRFYRLRVTETNGTSIIQPEFKTDLSKKSEWVKDDLVLVVSSISTNWRMTVETGSGHE